MQNVNFNTPKNLNFNPQISGAINTQAPSDKASIHQAADKIFHQALDQSKGSATLKSTINQRYLQHKDTLINSLDSIYGDSFDELYKQHHSTEEALNAIIPKIVKAAMKRPEALQAIDKSNKNEYLNSNERVCASVYLDHTCGSLKNIDKTISDLKKLNVDMLHFMPTLFPGPEGLDEKGEPVDNDGGYSIKSQRKVNPQLGKLPGETKEPSLGDVFKRFTDAGIDVIADFTINHTSDQSERFLEWKKGNPKYKDFYMAVDNDMCKSFQKNLVSVFPKHRESSFTYDNDIKNFVWTTFKNSQKDINWRNPAVAGKTFSDVFFLANAGAKGIRIDAAPCAFKRMDTNCMSQPEVFPLFEALRASMEIVAPSSFMLAESINKPEEVIPFIQDKRCELAYNTAIATNNLPAIANQNINLLRDSLYHFVQETKSDGLWVNAERTHDEFALHVSDKVAKDHGIKHSEFNTDIHNFLTGNKEGSYSKGTHFQSPPERGQIAGTLASFLGLEKALEDNDQGAVDKAIERIKLTKAIRYALPGIPLVNVLGGDHLGSLNNPDTSKDSRDVHRISHEDLSKTRSPMHQKASDKIYASDTQLLEDRKNTPAFAGKDMLILDAGSQSILAFNRQNEADQCLVIGNYSESPQELNLDSLYPYAPEQSTDINSACQQAKQPFSTDNLRHDMIQDKTIDDKTLTLQPHQVVWLKP